MFILPLCHGKDCWICEIYNKMKNEKILYVHITMLHGHADSMSDTEIMTENVKCVYWQSSAVTGKTFIAFLLWNWHSFLSWSIWSSKQILISMVMMDALSLSCVNLTQIFIFPVGNEKSPFEKFYQKFKQLLYLMSSEWSCEGTRHFVVKLLMLRSCWSL